MTEAIAEAIPPRAERNDARARLHAPIDRELLVPGAAMLGFVALVAGQRAGDAFWITPDEGIGYALGIAGLRSDAGAAALLGSQALAARCTNSVRCATGSASTCCSACSDPSRSCFTANFRVGSRNGAVALVSMLLVAGSGFIGRYVYTRVHHGLFGHRQSLRELARDVESSRGALGATLAGCPPLAELVRAHESSLLGASRIPLSGPLRVLLVRCAHARDGCAARGA